MRAQMNLDSGYLTVVSVLEGLLYVMLAVCVTVSIFDAYAYIMLGEYPKAWKSGGFGCYFWWLFVGVPEISRQMLDSKVTNLQFTMNCIKWLLPGLFKAVKVE